MIDLLVEIACAENHLSIQRNDGTADSVIAAGRPVFNDERGRTARTMTAKAFIIFIRSPSGDTKFPAE